MKPSNHARPAGTLPAPTQEQIAALAHEIWRERGCPEGSDVDIWLEAERQLNGGAPKRTRTKDSIPADPSRVTPDEDPALNPAVDRELDRTGGGSDLPSPTSWHVR